jgi:hypothetical protein
MLQLTALPVEGLMRFPNGRLIISKTKTLIVIAFAATTVFFSVAARATTIDQVLGSPSAYDGQHVEVTGKVGGLRETVSRKGNPYATFSLCSERCIHVFTFGSPRISNGQTITVHGTFESVKHQGEYMFYNEIDADEGSF